MIFLTRVFLTFVVSGTLGAISFEVADYLSRRAYELDALRPMIIGTIFGAAWIPASFLARKSLVGAILIGCAMPILVPIFTVIGVWLVFIVIAFFYVFIPIGFLNGLIVYMVWLHSKQTPTQDVSGDSGLSSCRAAGLASDNPYEPPFS